MTSDEFESQLEELESAEDFLDYFDVDYDPAIVHVNRLHILQRFHDYLEDIEKMPADVAEYRPLYAGLLADAYQDFVQSDVRTQKVFRVFRLHEAQTAKVDLADLTAQLPHAS